MKTNRWWLSVLLLAGAAARCSSPGPQTSSSSHWVECKTVSDCAANATAVACKDGYCVDARGDRVSPSADAGSSDAFGSGTGGAGGSCSAMSSPVGDAAASCVLTASDYDRTCAGDHDCVEVGVGNACSTPCEVLCPSTAISVHAYAQYQADFAVTPLASCPDTFCGCPTFGVARCRDGLCEVSLSEQQDSGGAPRDAMSDADSGTGTGLACATSIQEFCAQDSLCIESWPLDPIALCVLQPIVSLAESCGGYHVVHSQGVDSSATYYYDATLGQLVAIVSYGLIGGLTCTAGPPNFVQPSCDYSRFVTVSCSDH